MGCPETNLLDEWLRSRDGQKAINPETLGIAQNNAQYLRNRLHNAFMAGCDAGKRIARDQALAAFRRAILLGE